MGSTSSRCRGHAKEPRFRVDGMQFSVGTDLHPSDVITDALAFHPDGGDQHGQVGLAAGGRKAAAIWKRLPCGCQAQDEHMLGQPTSLRAKTDAMRKARHFLPRRALPPYPEP